MGQRDISYWDDSKGASKWVCAVGTFKACVGANANDAAKEGACTEFESECAAEEDGGSALPLLATVSKADARIIPDFADRRSVHAWFWAIPLIAAAAAVATLVASRTLRSARRSYEVLGEENML